jgi:hypothetical protein
MAVWAACTKTRRPRTNGFAAKSSPAEMRGFFFQPVWPSNNVSECSKFGDMMSASSHLQITRYMSFRTLYFRHLCPVPETRHDCGKRLYVPSTSRR